MNGNDDRRSAVVEALNALDDAVDAVSDTILAESVYQMVQGNPARAGATLDSMTNAEALPAELEVAQSPRSGVALTHRVLALLPATDPAPPQGAEDVEPALIRAQAEPRLGAWAASLLGELEDAVYLIEYCDPESGEPLEPAPRRITLAQVRPGISQLDVVYDSAGGEGGSVLEQRIVYHAVRARPEGMRPDVRVRLTLQAEDGTNENTISLADLLELARAFRELLAGARPLGPRDLSRPEATAQATIDSEELGERAMLARGTLEKTRAGLAAAVNGQDLESIRRELLRAAAFGAPGSIPLSATGAAAGDAGALAAQGKAVAGELDRRIKAADAESDALEQLRAIFGASFRVLPRITITTPDADETLDVAFATSAALQGAPTAATEWAHRVSRARTGVARLTDVLTYGEILRGMWEELHVGQLPKHATRWSALPFGPDSEPSGGLSYVAHLPIGAVDRTRPLTGLLVDEWVEVIPSATETTAVAVNYDRPSSTAPHAILVAVPPRDDLARWDLDTLAETVRQTFDLARIRAVDRDALREVGHFLPASYLALNLLGATVASDLRHGTGIPLTVRQ